ncbi:transketolase [Dysgonomonas macrotermitis]|uniref:Transketolase n=1 Tax=Dysgonomonas macrotermitis TaxID=1346286 RepID=A0A1M5F853_9BACT|nr:transketolase [Dysgonomonas macrotermitis]SHF87558.1 transketolase [Dysgonomonas macrotermitis]
MINESLKLRAEKIRLRLIEVIYKAKAGHTGGDLSAVNVLTALYFHTLDVDAANPKMENRDRFIMSKGHCAEALYCVLESAGFLTKEVVDTYGDNYSPLAGHPTVKNPGVEINTGALGHGLSAGVGVALSAKIDGKDYKTFVLMGDGEQAEGSIYEAAMAANKYKLDNLVAIIDRNGLQISGSTEDVMPLESIKERWTAFGWDVIEMDGDNMDVIVKTFDNINFSNNKPHLIISRTTKGKGISYMENVPKWHHGIPTAEEYEKAVSEISERICALSE